jgi:hypothetical protein
MQPLDTQIAEFVPEVKAALGLEGEVALKLATSVGAELRFLSTQAKKRDSVCYPGRRFSSAVRAHCFPSVHGPSPCELLPVPLTPC